MSMGKIPRLAIGLVMLLAAFTSACSTQARRVDCDGRLEPINRPAPKVKAAQASAPPAHMETRDR